MKKNHNYSFRQIETFAHEENYEMTELGGETIGKAFIVLEHNERDITISFVLTGSSSNEGFIYTCIYSDFI